MTTKYEDAITSLLNDDPELAIHLILERMKQSSMQQECPVFVLSSAMDECDVQHATDFLPFHGWEAS
jgi:hypothetical protein